LRTRDISRKVGDRSSGGRKVRSLVELRVDAGVGESMRRTLFALACLVAVLGSFGGARAVPVPVLASTNVELLANIPEAGAIGGRFGLVNGTRYFFATGVNGLSVYNAAVPSAPLLVGTLPLPHEENEDVDLSVNRGLVLISEDSVQAQTPGVLYVIDISILPNAPRVIAAFPYPRNPANNRLGAGHIANCILDCQYAWITGSPGGDILSLNLSNPAAPTVAGWFHSPAGNPNGVFTSGVIHDVNVDQYDSTKVWVTGSRGTAVYSVTTAAQAANPGTPVASFDAVSAGLNTFIHHNSLRPSANLLLVTEEDWEHVNNSCTTNNQGRFETYSVTAGGGSITPLAQFRTDYLGGTYVNGKSPVQATCSAHWFDYRASDGLVAIGWYNQGVRFLSVSAGGAISQVGYWLAPGATAFAAYFHPDASDVVWVTDGSRGLDVLKFVGSATSSPAVAGPRVPARATSEPVRFTPSPTWGYACLVGASGR
jgi:hypothetical protein